MHRKYNKCITFTNIKLSIEELNFDRSVCMAATCYRDPIQNNILLQPFYIEIWKSYAWRTPGICCQYCILQDRSAYSTFYRNIRGPTAKNSCSPIGLVATTSFARRCCLCAYISKLINAKPVKYFNWISTNDIPWSTECPSHHSSFLLGKRLNTCSWALLVECAAPLY